MGILYDAYDIITRGVLLTALPPFWAYSRISGRYGDNLKERLGFLPDTFGEYLEGVPRIWVHAVSLGEVRAAEPIVNAIRRYLPSCTIMVSTITKHGRELAHGVFGKSIPVTYAPLDHSGMIRRCLTRARPDILLFLETEIWPVWLREAKKMGINTAIVNGRISLRSIRIYQKLRPFFKEVLKNVDAFSMIRKEDAQRIISMGADPDRVVINGNSKYDLLSDLTDPSFENEMRSILDIKNNDQVLIAGSTRSGEEAIIIKAYKRILKEFPKTILVIAPRHIGRTPAIELILKKNGFNYQLRSSLGGGITKRRSQVVILDTFGELFKVYSIATIVFCGASLVPLGGQNPMEPAVWGKPVMYGPSMEDFLDAKELLEGNKAGIEVSSAKSFAEKAIRLLSDRSLLDTYCRRSREAVLKNRNASEKHASVIAGLFKRIHVKSGDLNKEGHCDN